MNYFLPVILFATFAYIHSEVYSGLQVKLFWLDQLHLLYTMKTVFWEPSSIICSKQVTLAYYQHELNAKNESEKERFYNVSEIRGLYSDTVSAEVEVIAIIVA